jgi:hypothetical protein
VAPGDLVKPGDMLRSIAGARLRGVHVTGREVEGKYPAGSLFVDDPEWHHLKEVR